MVNIRKAIIIWTIQYFEADFLGKVSLEILNLGIILKTYTHAYRLQEQPNLPNH